MFLYYLIDLNSGQPIILYLYFGQQSKFTKEELTKKMGYSEKEIEQLIYSKVPITEIFGLQNICNDDTEKNIYFLYSGGYDFYYSIADTLQHALEIAEQSLIVQDLDDLPIAEYPLKDIIPPDYCEPKKID